MQAILALIKKQFLEILSSTQLRSLTLIAPVIQLILFGMAANLDVRNITMAVLDFDRSAESRALVRSFTNSEYFTVVRYLDRYNQADSVLQNGDAKIVIVLPPEFGARILERRTVPVQGLVDGSDGNTASIASGYAGGIMAAYSQNILMTVGEGRGAVPAAARIDLPRFLSW